MSTLYFGNYLDKTEEEIKADLIRYYTPENGSEIRSVAEYLESINILIAYLESGYDESSYFLFHNNKLDKYFELHASHSSYCGFEECFSPKETTTKYLKSKHFPITYFYFMSEEDKMRLKNFIATLE